MKYKLLASTAGLLIATGIGGCVTTTVTGPDLRFEGPEYEFRGLLTVVELDRHGKEMNRTSDPAVVNARLAFDPVVARKSELERGPNDPPDDYLRFTHGGRPAPAHYPAGHSGRRRLEISLPSPSPRCRAARYIFAVDWTWRNDRVIRSHLTGAWKPKPVAPCVPGDQHVMRLPGYKGGRRGPGFVQYNIGLGFGAPVENLITHAIVGPAVAGNASFASLGVSVRGDGTARYGGSHGVKHDPK